MKIFFFTLFALILPTISWAQFDSSTKSTSFGSSFGVTPSKAKSSIFSPQDAPSAEPNTSPLREEKRIDLTEKTDFIKKEFKLQPNYIKGEADMKDEYKRGKYFGDFRSKSKFIKVMCRDHEAVDGDRVSIILNDQVVEGGIFLSESFKTFFIELQPGFNNLEFLALNQGESGPNTAQFMVQDEFGNILLSDIWNLATGAKASLTVVKE
jgi:hypothetical protein